MVTRISAESRIYASGFEFLARLKKNNNREWFNAHKEQFLEEQKRMELFADGLLTDLNRHDLIETPSGKDSLHRIYRDTRFSSDKTPYKTRWHGSFRRATKYRRGGYHFNIQPGSALRGGDIHNRWLAPFCAMIWRSSSMLVAIQSVLAP